MSLLLGSVLGAIPCSAVEAESPTSRRPLYILSFNSWGELQNPGELDLAIEELKSDDSIERIIILAYGWSNDGQASYSTYQQMVEEMTANMPAGSIQRSTAIIAVGWDSSQTGFRKLFTDLIPLPGVGAAIAWLPDQLLFPLSFWSKAAQADRIGFGGLRTALNGIFDLYDDREEHPEIVLVGHSFGTRILASLLAEDVGGSDSELEPFHAIPHVRGVALLQPALVAANLNTDAPYPILVTMSRHDHSIGLLYPIVNIDLNSYAFTMFEAIVSRRVIRPLDQGLGMADSAITTVLPSRESDSRPDDSSHAGTHRTYVEDSARHVARRGRRTFGEVLALPLTLGFTIVVTPIAYAYIQVRSLLTHPASHLMDSLAQMPVVEIPVAALSKSLNREVTWGQRSKGVFTLGPIHEGLGRLAVPRIFERHAIPVYSLTDISALESPPNGVFVVDASEIISRGAFGLDLENPMVDFTLSWLDPVGSHGDYKNPEVMALVSWMANSTEFVWP